MKDPRTGRFGNSLRVNEIAAAERRQRFSHRRCNSTADPGPRFRAKVFIAYEYSSASMWIRCQICRNVTIGAGSPLILRGYEAQGPDVEEESRSIALCVRHIASALSFGVEIDHGSGGIIILSRSTKRLARSGSQLNRVLRTSDVAAVATVERLMRRTIQGLKAWFVAPEDQDFTIPAMKHALRRRRSCGSGLQCDTWVPDQL